MKRVSLLLIAAFALVIATTAVLLIQVVSPTEFAPPVVSPSRTIVVLPDSPVTYLFSAASIKATSNATVDFRLISLLGTPYIAVNGPLPADVKIPITYTDPITGSSYTLTLVNRSTTRKVYYVLSGTPAGCTSYGNIGTIDSFVGTVRASAVVRRVGDIYILYPNLTEVGYMLVSASNLVVYRPDGSKWIDCTWHKLYLNTTTYNLNIGYTAYNLVVGDRSLTIVVRPFVVGAVWAKSSAEVNLELS